MNNEENNYQLYVCLPFLHLDMEEPIHMGPIRFFPSDRVGGAVVSIHPAIPDEKKNELLIDGLHLLYYTSTYFDIYHSSKPPLFEAFTNLMPIPQKPTRKEMDQMESFSSSPENIYHLSHIEPVMCKGLGSALNLIYLVGETEDNENRIAESKRLIRSIRYFVNSFYEKFKVLTGQGITLSEKLYEPEDALILATAFEALFNIDPIQSSPEFKQKMRPILQLKFGKPVELMWKWIDGFYSMRNRVIHSGDIPEQMFNANENYTIPYLMFGIKLFIYSVYFKLAAIGFIPTKHRDSFQVQQFEGIEREEVVGFLWPEADLLRKISLLVMQIEQGRVGAEYLSDLQMLGNIYQHMIRHYFFQKSPSRDIQFQPEEKEKIVPIIDAILSHSIEEVTIENQVTKLSSLYPEGLIQCLQKRAA